MQGKTAIFPESVEFTDGRFAVRLEGPTASSLSPGDLATAQRRSRFAGADQDLGPERARLGCVFLADARGHRGDAASLADVEAGKDLTAALERYLDDFFPTTDEHQQRCGACG